MYLVLTPEIRPSESYNVYVFALPERLAATPAGRGLAPAANTAVTAAAAPAKCLHPKREATARSSTRDSVYTAAQSDSGRRLYTAQQCATCHGATLQGTAVGPALAGEEFLKAWRDDSLGTLSACIQATMPPGAAGRLSMADYRDLAAALLEANGIKAD
jgi:mono/diheme cytochrome c family protein